MLQNSRHYKKISGDFDLIRNPMYQYTKELKEKLFSDFFFAILWIRYRISLYGSENIQGKLEGEVELDP